MKLRLKQLRNFVLNWVTIALLGVLLVPIMIGMAFSDNVIREWALGRDSIWD